MLWSCVKTEQKKLRHSQLWLAFLVIPVVEVVKLIQRRHAGQAI